MGVLKLSSGLGSGGDMRLEIVGIRDMVVMLWLGGLDGERFDVVEVRNLVVKGLVNGRSEVSIPNW